jgi:hypothetical protein
VPKFQTKSSTAKTIEEYKKELNKKIVVNNTLKNPEPGDIFFHGTTKADKKLILNK